MSRVALPLLCLGLLQMTADLAGWTRLRGLAAATGASPAPRVFSAARGLETYSSRFFIVWDDVEGDPKSVELTPDRYAGLAGPYNRRNAYGAAVAYGPVLAADPATRPLLEALLRHALCGEAPLLRELGLDPDTMRNVRIRVAPEGTPPDLPLVLAGTCP